MTHYQNIIVGFGKAGKTLAKTLSQHGQEVLLIEKDAQMYGGTCINVACIPTKSLITSAHRGLGYAAAFGQKRQLTEDLRSANYHKVADAPEATVLDATATFIDDHTLQVQDASGKRTLEAERIFINTGSTPIQPPIPGLATSKHVYTSKTLMDQAAQLKRLLIIGSGPIGLEFAAMYAQFGSQVTVVAPDHQILKHVDPAIAAMAAGDLRADGVELLLDHQVVAVADTPGAVAVTVDHGGQQQILHADGVLVATGRRANTDDLHLERTTIQTDARGFIQVDDRLQTTAPGVWALGDVAGSPQFTYISLDDWRIVVNQLFGDRTRTRQNRPVFATTTFLNPPLATVGQTQAQLEAGDRKYQLLSLPVKAIPKAGILDNRRGIYQALVDPKTHEILGATLYAEEAHEVINLIALAMQHHLPAEALRDQIYSHPTMSEGLNDLFAGLA